MLRASAHHRGMNFKMPVFWDGNKLPFMLGLSPASAATTSGLARHAIGVESDNSAVFAVARQRGQYILIIGKA